ncbi:MAG TPA: hypothetical protein PLN13_09425 [Bacteroidia bacterium]|nr:hypothetical protein [Bacteroidia bacterium]HRH08789.1 hypothetical protein [Bacteroidia bacterium]
MKKHYQAFLSCSFKEEDKEINTFIEVVCKAFGFITINLNHASNVTPAPAVNKLISESNCLIAICTKRDRIVDSKLYNMPESVKDEIAFAFSLKKPILIIYDDEIKPTGFLPSIGTWISFKTNRHRENEFISGLITSFEKLKTNIKENKIDKNLSGTFFNEEFSNLITLEATKDGYSWNVIATKLLKFNKKLNNVPIMTRVWPCAPVSYPKEASNGIYEVILHSSSREFNLHQTVDEIGPDKVALSIGIMPDPEKNDFIKFSRKFTSPYINQLDLKAVSVQYHPININGKKYFAYDGVQPAEKTKKLILKFCFPDFSGVKIEDITPIAANHGVGFNSINVEEWDRISSEVQQFGKYIFVNMEVDFPLLNCLYGIAWIPPDELLTSNKGE